MSWLLSLPLVLCSAFHSPRDPNVDDFSLGVGEGYGKSPTAQVCHRKKYSAGVDGFLFLTLGPAWSHFHILHIALSSWVCTATLNLILLHMVCFTYVRCFLLLFLLSCLSLKPVLPSSRSAFIYLTIGELLPTVGSPVPDGIAQCWTPQHLILCPHFPIAGLCFSTQHHYVSHKHPILHRITVCNYCVHKAMIVSSEDKQIKTNLRHRIVASQNG